MNKKKLIIVIIAVLILGAGVFLLGERDKEHQYFCDKFMLTVDDKQYD